MLENGCWGKSVSVRAFSVKGIRVTQIVMMARMSVCRPVVRVLLETISVKVEVEGRGCLQWLLRTACKVAKDGHGEQFLYTQHLCMMPEH